MSPKYFLWTVTDFVKIHKKSLIEKIKEDNRGIKRDNISCTDYQNRNQPGLAPYQVYMRNHILHFYNILINIFNQKLVNYMTFGIKFLKKVTFTKDLQIQKLNSQIFFTYNFQKK